MHELYSSGATLEEVGERFGLTRERVRQVFVEAGLATRSNSETQALRRERIVRERTEEICAEFARSGDVNEVAQRLGIARVLVKEVVSRHFARLSPQFGPRGKNQRYSDDELLFCVRKAAEAVPGALTTTAYIRYIKGQKAATGRPWPAYQTVAERFGTWQNALTHAGVVR
jgi:hypothetical protein